MVAWPPASSYITHRKNIERELFFRQFKKIFHVIISKSPDGTDAQVQTLSLETEVLTDVAGFHMDVPSASLF